MVLNVGTHGEILGTRRTQERRIAEIFKDNHINPNSGTEKKCSRIIVGFGTLSQFSTAWV